MSDVRRRWLQLQDILQTLQDLLQHAAVGGPAQIPIAKSPRSKKSAQTPTLPKTSDHLRTTVRTPITKMAFRRSIHRHITIMFCIGPYTQYLNDLLRCSLDEIGPRLQVAASISALIRAVDKEFSLSANYPKGPSLATLGTAISDVASLDEK
jgi:hypothetical protein